MSAVDIKLGSNFTFTANGTAATCVGFAIGAVGVGAATVLIGKGVKNNPQATRCVQAICRAVQNAWGVVTDLRGGSLKIEIMTKNMEATHKLFNDWYSGDVLLKLNQSLKDAFAEENEEALTIESLLLDKMETVEKTDNDYEAQKTNDSSKEEKSDVEFTFIQAENMQKLPDMSFNGYNDKTSINSQKFRTEIKLPPKDKLRSYANIAPRAFDDSNDDVIKREKHESDFPKSEKQPEIIKKLRNFLQEMTNSVCWLEEDFQTLLPNYIQSLETTLLSFTPMSDSDFLKAESCLGNCSENVPKLCALALFFLRKTRQIADDKTARES